MNTLLEIFKTMDYGPAPESPAAVDTWLEEHGRKFGLFIDNQWITPEEAQYYPSINPAKGELLAETAQAGQKDALVLRVFVARVVAVDEMQLAGAKRERGECNDGCQDFRDGPAPGAGRCADRARP